MNAMLAELKEAQKNNDTAKVAEIDELITEFAKAQKNGDMVIFTEILEAIEDIYPDNHYQRTRLHQLCIDSRSSKIFRSGFAKSLLSDDANILSKSRINITNSRKDYINKQSLNEGTALHIASEACRPEAVKFLIKNGAEINILSNPGVTPLDTCAKVLDFSLKVDTSKDFDRQRSEATSLSETLAF